MNRILGALAFFFFVVVGVTAQQPTETPFPPSKEFQELMKANAAINPDGNGGTLNQNLLEGAENYKGIAGDAAALKANFAKLRTMLTELKLPAALTWVNAGDEAISTIGRHAADAVWQQAGDEREIATNRREIERAQIALTDACRSCHHNHRVYVIASPVRFEITRLARTGTAAPAATQPPAAAVSPLDASMKQIGTSLGTSIEAMLSMSYADARTPLADVRKGLAEAEAFFAARANRANGVTFAKAAQKELEAFEQSLAAAAMITPTAPAESPLDPLMKKIGPAVAAAGKALASRAWADARTQLETVRVALTDVESFFASRNTTDGVKFAKDTLAKVNELDAQLASGDVDAGAAIATNRQLNTACGACHNVFRIRVNNNFVLKPGSAPTPELTTARNALRGLQTACRSCHSTYRQVSRGEWTVRPGT